MRWLDSIRLRIRSLLHRRQGDLGKSILLDGISYRIVGVMPPCDFHRCKLGD